MRRETADDPFFKPRSRAMGVPRSGVGLMASLLVSLIFLRSPAAPGARAQAPPAAGVYWVYVGTYTSGGGPDGSRGIYRMEFDAHSGELGAPRLAAESTDPSFLAIHPNREFLYAVNESGDVKGRRDGG